MKRVTYSLIDSGGAAEYRVYEFQKGRFWIWEKVKGRKLQIYGPIRGIEKLEAFLQERREQCVNQK